MSGDEKDELLRDIEAELERASDMHQTGINGNYLDGYRRAVRSRTEEAVNNLLSLLQRAKVNKGVRW